MAGEKKKWVDPVLRVLIRNKPEESVMGACKAGGGFAQYDIDNRCMDELCGVCMGMGVS